jgi:hypothetical protein
VLEVDGDLLLHRAAIMGFEGGAEELGPGVPEAFAGQSEGEVESGAGEEFDVGAGEVFEVGEAPAGIDGEEVIAE